MGAINVSIPVEADQIRQGMAEPLNPIELLQNKLSPVIGTHVDPGTMGLAYCTDGEG